MKCPKCDTVNPDDSKFCKDCGTNIDTSQPQPTFTQTVAAPIRELSRGTLFADRYEIIEELGKGGMGKVYRVEDKKINQEVALKLIKPEIASDKNTLERFHNELKTARMISHRHVCRMFDMGESHENHFITMEYVQGEDLKSMIRMSGQLGIGTALTIGKQICQGLSEAHGLDVIHRDLKPNNIMIDKQGNARIMDFGIARSLKAKGITGSGVMIGTPEYMSPEQVDGKEVDQRSDIYSLGIILYEMLTGRLPFEGDTPFSIGVKQKSEIPEPPQKYNPRVPDDLNQLILKCLEKEKEDRPQNTGEICAEINRIEEGIPTTTKPLSDKKTRTSREVTVTFTTRKILIPALVFIAVVVVGIFLWRTLRPSDVYVPPEERFPIAVISFENQTGDETYAHLQKVIPNLLITNLEESGYFNVTSWQRLKDLLKQTDTPDVDFIDADLGFRLCRMEGVEAIVIGSYAKAGDMFATDVKVLDVASKKLLKSTTSQGEGEGSILKTQINELSREISLGVGISERRLDTTPMRIEDLTTGSMEAYTHFVEGLEAVYNFYYIKAHGHFQKAIEIDPGFGAPHFFLAYLYTLQQNTGARNEAIKKAKELATRKVTEYERLWTDTFYAIYIERNVNKAIGILEELAVKYPKEKDIYNTLGAYTRADDPEKAIEHYQKAFELDPNFAGTTNNLAYTYLEIGKFEEAEKYFNRYIELAPGEANPYDSIGDLFVNMGKLEEAEEKFLQASKIRPKYFSSYEKLAYVSALKQDYPKAIEWLQKNLEVVSASGDKMDGYMRMGHLLAWIGRYDEALSELVRAEELAEAIENKFAVAFIDRLRTWIYLDMDELELSRSSNKTWLDVFIRSFPDRNVLDRCDHLMLQGYIDLKMGQTDAAKQCLESIKALDPDISSIQYHLFQGDVLLADNSVDSAITNLERAKFDRISANLQYAMALINYNLPMYADGLAQAYYRKGDLNKAIAEYINLTAINPEDNNRRLIHPKYHYRLAKLYEEKGDSAKALEHYQKFLTFWKDADSGIAEVEDARKKIQ